QHSTATPRREVEPSKSIHPNRATQIKPRKSSRSRPNGQAQAQAEQLEPTRPSHSSPGLGQYRKE
ncbi:hypothetical protein BGZ94_003369, partial [Podila epigama]